MLKMSDLRGLTIDELNDKVDKLKKELMQYRFQSKTGKLEKQSAISHTKKDIARVMTVVSEQLNTEKKTEVKS